MLKYKITRGDIFIIGVMLLIALISILFLLLINSDKGEYFEVNYFSGSVTRSEKYSLNINRVYTFTNNSYTLSVTVKDKTVYVSESNCENQICVHSKPISVQGTSIICAPAGIEIKIVSSKGDAYADDIAG